MRSMADTRCFCGMEDGFATGLASHVVRRNGDRKNQNDLRQQSFFEILLSACMKLAIHRAEREPEIFGFAIGGNLEPDFVG